MILTGRIKETVGDIQVRLVAGAILALSSRDSNISPQTVGASGRKRRNVSLLKGKKKGKKGKKSITPTLVVNPIPYMGSDFLEWLSLNRFPFFK